MTSVLASAPGKVVLSGEYAVLDGAPAIAMAVDRRATVTLSAIEGEISEVRAPAYTPVVGHFQISEAGVNWQDGRDVFGAVNAVLRAVEAAPGSAIALNLDTAEFIDTDTRRKIGIGSSAALTVALCAAVRESTDVAAIARRAHADLQGGAGSGVDVACSLSGGLIEYRMEGCSARVLHWPASLFYGLVWTGTVASTKDKLEKLDAGLSRPSRVRLASASEAMAKAWVGGSATNVLVEYRDYCESLFQFSIDHDLGIFDAGHDELWRAAVSANLVYKPCGAGGGDIGIVLSTNEAALAAFLGRLPTKYRVLDYKLDTTGVRVDIRTAERP